MIELQLFGVESTFWAQGYKNKNKKASKDQIKERIQQKNVIVDVRQQIKVEYDKGKLSSVPFSIALPEWLPNSFYYCGDQLSVISV